MKMNNFQGDLTDISAKKEALLVTFTEQQYTVLEWTVTGPCYYHQ